MRKKKKWLTYSINGFFVALIAFFGYVQISMLVTKSGNHGVPSAFGYSFLYVFTDSMDNPNKGVDDLGTGSGILIHKDDLQSCKLSNPIYKVDENGNLVTDSSGNYIIADYDFSGDVVTFYSKNLGYVDTHRLVMREFDASKGKWRCRTLGDNPSLHVYGAPKLDPWWYEDDYVGRVVHSSKGFGTMLTLISPDAAASVGKTAWLLPVAIIVPMILLAVLSIADVYKTARIKEKEDENKILEAMAKAGIDPNDEVASATFRAKEELKLEYKAKLAEETERAKKMAEKELKKKQKEGEKKQ